MNRERLLTIAVVALLVLNLGTLAFLFLHRPHPPRRPDMPPPGEMTGRGNPGVDRLIKESLDLTDPQIRTFDTLKRQHHEAILKIDSANDIVLRRYFSLLTTPHTSSRDSLEAALAQFQIQRARITAEHFAALRGMLTAEQQTRFDSLVPHLTEILGSHGPQRPGPRGPMDGPPEPRGDRPAPPGAPDGPRR